MNTNRHKMAVAAHLLLTNDQGDVLFLRRANTGYADGQWSVPAGHVDAGETVVAACIRETSEELDVALTESDVHPLLVQHKRDTDGEERIDFFFSAVLPVDQVPVIAEPEKCDGLLWAPAARPPTPLVAYVGAAIRATSVENGPIVSYFGFDQT